MDAALQALRSDVATCEALESGLKGKAPPTEAKARGGGKRDATNGNAAAKRHDVAAVLNICIEACQSSRKRHREESPPAEPVDDTSLSQYSRFTREFALAPYQQFLHYVPRLVNVVTLAEALPVPGSGITLPLDLASIAARCKGSFYAPRRFAAVQLAYSNPRCRVLVFHTGRLVGTGCQGSAAARLAIARAQRQLSEDANVHLHVRNFAVINQVGAVSLRATLNCDAFATEHSAESHFDRSSFVGLAWRPPRENICCEIYSTGRANLPGSIAERQLLESFSRMLPELLRFSSASHLLSKISEDMQAHHRVNRADAGSSADTGSAPVHRQFVVANKTRQKLAGGAAPSKKAVGIWDGWEDASAVPDQPQLNLEDDGDDDIDLGSLGL